MNYPVDGVSGRVALVTGASSGLGAHFAGVLARAGALVVIAARRRDRLDVLATAIRADGGQVMAVTLDVTDEDSIASALQEVDRELGPVSILVNNAGMAESKTFLKLDEEKWSRTLEVNLNGAWRVAHQVTRKLVAEGQTGVVVNIASILGLRVGFANTAYAVSKAGLIQMTKTMALELGPRGIRVNALCPGYFATDINADYFATPEGADYIRSTPAGRTGKLEELDGPLLLLCSDAGSFINGITLPVDGGHLVSSL